MNRHYTIETFREKVLKLKRLVTNLNLTTDIIVGFPGEESIDFEETVNLLKEVRFDDAYMYKYNVRENTLAAKKLNDDVSEEEKLARLDTIIKLQKNIQRDNKKKRVGSVVEVIAEKFSKKDKEQILANSQEDLMVLFKGDEKDFDDILNLKITGVVAIHFMVKKSKSFTPDILKFSYKIKIIGFIMNNIAILVLYYNKEKLTAQCLNSIIKITLIQRSFTMTTDQTSNVITLSKITLKRLPILAILPIMAILGALIEVFRLFLSEVMMGFYFSLTIR